MINQPIDSDSLNISAAEISPAQRVYAVQDLPPEVQEKLLRLQNSDGYYLKSSSGATEPRVILLGLVTVAAIGLAAIIADSASELKSIIGKPMMLYCYQFG